jgi:hypothetical protein
MNLWFIPGFTLMMLESRFLMDAVTLGENSAEVVSVQVECSPCFGL